ncbi:hypothetical protein CSH63_05415 [Micromonospora tulbaghiae]|uniref:DUF2637 domain-containing protein n=1 Tax=Micromonospora tulbaghiae TaxID=479978 RepID=A0A386WGS0_9ACTN|nr:DUF2637 domain-containing protein [Micromonospora tulbaghiae]AYF26892.1 hypothetical protein CSH63_05415 [Micromonospora tulbaghiae]NED56477.1 DUF2637 domain-containing protein [Micromonospora aurantiaca]
MTASTVNVARNPRNVRELLPAAREITQELGGLPSRHRLMRTFRIGAPKADELLNQLTEEWRRASAVDEDGPPKPNYQDSPGGTSAQQVAEVTSEAAHAPVTARPLQEAAEPRALADVDLASLKKIRWSVRSVLAFGVAASVAGNVLHARDDLISQLISAWSPLALLLTLELISRVPVHRRSLGLARWAATALIAAIAAWVSYWHMAAVASRFGETNGSQYLLPLSVDGLVIVASISLVELGERIAAVTKER